jgi:hypothetical protein
MCENQMTITRPCDWCPDDTCSDYWRVQVFNKTYRICNCCYEHLRKETEDERKIETGRYCEDRLKND